jgi:NADH:ubiquinone oxidoreductase subunit F (NADH-binding)
MIVLVSRRTEVAAPRDENRLLSASGPSRAEHLERFGGLPPVTPALLDELQSSGLSGRGGGAFPTWRKLRSARGRDPVLLVANGAEGEPLSAKDAVLLQRAPHLVLDGLLIAARLLGAGEVRLYAEASQLARVARAIGERTDAAGIGLTEAPAAFIAGEASAVANAVATGRAVPLDHRLPLTTAEGRRPPTVVQNVETLANIALIARFGPDWFRGIGSADEPGSRLVTLSGDVPHPGVVEVAAGAPLGEALARSGVDAHSLRAVLVGGYHGAWVPGSALATPLGRESLRPFGAAPGAGVLMALGAGRCGIRQAAAIANYLAAQSARQCGPCINGLPALAAILARVAAMDRSPAHVDRLRELAELVTGRGSCHHPDGTARFVLSTLTVFAADVDAHRHGFCREVTP